MRRLASLAMIAATTLALAAPQTASAAPCEEGHVFLYCGDHIRRFQVMKFRLNTSKPSSLSGVANGILTQVVRAAAFEWDRHWPVPNPSIAFNASRLPGDCQFAARAICYDGTTTAGYDLYDGINTIVFASPALCGGLGNATACIRYDGTSSSGSKRIKEVDILLNPSQPWGVATCPDDLPVPSADRCADYAIGQVPSFGGGSWIDLQSVVTHELGHAVGLEHFGNTDEPWPSNLSDSARFTQTMYRWTIRETTYQQSLDYGDIGGLQRAALESLRDP